MSDLKDNKRVSWPARAVVTAGMPYGNKPLHFGHIGGVFVPADAFARFLRDRIGADNVRFVSGTDCFGSPINEGYRKLVEAGEFSGTIEDYVLRNHEAQKRTLESYDISLDIFDGSGIGHAGEVHQMVTDAFIAKLYENGWLKRDATLQFYDTQAETFLNGRQVVGRCPVQGCKSEHAYADECDLGHQYAPADLIAPVSSVSGTVPEMRPVENWYFDLPAFADFLRRHVDALKADPEVRAIVPQTIAEFLAPPVIFVKNEAFEAYEAVASELPAHAYRAAEKGKASFEIEFASIDERDEARAVLAREGIRFRTSKTLVPFRITGNIEWGVSAPAIEGVEGLTVVLAGVAVGAYLVHHCRERRARAAARQLARLLVCRRRVRVPVYRAGQPVLLRRGAAGAVGGHGPGRPARRRRGRCAAPDHAGGEPSPAVRQDQGVLVGRGEAAYGRAAARALHPRTAACALPGAGARPEVGGLLAEAVRP